MKFLNIEIDNITMAEAVDRIDDMVCHSMNQYVVTPNVDHIIRLEKSESFREVYRQAALVLTDGQPLLWFARWFGTPIVEKVSGADLFPRVCERAAQKGYRMFFLGGEEGVADKAAENLREKYQGLMVVGTYAPPHGFEENPQELERIYEMLKKAHIDILVVCLGSPKQEIFSFEARKHVQIPVMLNFGAAINFESGYEKRAPLWMQRHGLEWFYRLLRNPKRMAKRYLVDDLAIFKICWKYRKYNENTD